MWKVGITCLLIIAVLGLSVSVSRAAELQSFKFEDQPKKVRLEFMFSAAVDPDIVNDFNANIISLRDPQLEFSRKQLSTDHRLDDDSSYDILRFVRFSQDEAYGELRIYVGWKVTPADAQVIRGERVLVVEIVKPFWLAEGIEDDGDAESADAEVNQDPVEADSGIEPTIDDSESDAASGTGDGDEDPVPGGLRDMEWPDPEPEEDPVPEPDSGEDTGESAVEPDDPAGGDPVESTVPLDKYTPLPSYTNFNLDEVPVKQLEFYNQPFDRALMDLVAGCGFNVMLAEGIDSMVMTLNFTQRELSLKRALDLLCITYDLEYTVEDDAIIVSPR